LGPSGIARCDRDAPAARPRKQLRPQPPAWPPAMPRARRI
jgi:hypothetical protein